jgi:hypothetical protein
MKKVFLPLVFVGMAIAVPIPIRRFLRPAALSGDVTMTQANNAPFRDGLYLGSLDAASGRAKHVCVGRWSSDEDRAWFTAGYQAGYQRGVSQELPKND